MSDIYKDLIQDFLHHLGKERNLSRNTISAYGRYLERFFTFLVLLFIFYLIPGLWKNENGQLTLLSGFPPPVFYSIYHSDSECPLGLNCFKDYEEGKAFAQANDKPILLDFTGWACVNCRKMEENVWSQPDVFPLLNEEYVIISLYIDDRNELPSIGVTKNI